MTLYVLYHNERFLIEPQNPIWQHYAEIAFWLVPHAVAGTCALLLAPLQFSERLRKRYTTTHHIVGRIYVIGALVLAPLGAYGQYLAEGSGAPREFTTLACRRCGDADDDDPRGVSLCDPAAHHAAPSMDDAKLRGGAGVFRRPSAGRAARYRH
jgi:hypothetical protein